MPGIQYIPNARLAATLEDPYYSPAELTVLDDAGANETWQTWTELNAAVDHSFMVTSVEAQNSFSVSVAPHGPIQIGYGMAGEERVVTMGAVSARSAVSGRSKFDLPAVSPVIPQGERLVARIYLASGAGTVSVRVDGIRLDRPFLPGSRVLTVDGAAWVNSAELMVAEGQTPGFLVGVSGTPNTILENVPFPLIPVYMSGVNAAGGETVNLYTGASGSEVLFTSSRVPEASSASENNVVFQYSPIIPPGVRLSVDNSSISDVPEGCHLLFLRPDYPPYPAPNSLEFS